MAGGTIDRLRNMRMGNKAHALVTLGNGDDSVDVAVVLLPSDIMLSINETVEERYHNIVQDGVEISNPKVNEVTRNQYYNQLLCMYCMRDVSDLDSRIFDNEKDVGSTLTLEDIKRVCEKYNELIINNSEKLETLKEEDYDELKKYLEVTPLSDLSIVSQVHLMYFLQTILSETLQTDN